MKWLNELNTVAFSSFTNQLLWIGSAASTQYLAHWCLKNDHETALVAAVPFFVMWFGFLTGKSGITAVRDAVKRNTDIDYVKAKEEGKATGAARAVVLAEAAADAKAKRTNGSGAAAPAAAPATVVQADHVENLEVNGGATATDPLDGMDDSRKDDERGEP
jgi:hypothetical protein